MCTCSLVTKQRLSIKCIGSNNFVIKFVSDDDNNNDTIFSLSYVVAHWTIQFDGREIT